MNDLQRLRELFDALVDVPAAQWDAWFELRQIEPAVRSELRRLAREDEEGHGVLDRSIGLLAQTLAAPTLRESDLIGGCIGPFRIERRLGEGGMASVFLARREGADFQQTVALKLLKRGALSPIEQSFFRRERQVLARLSHPNIARLIDGGVSPEGIAYLAMEYVDGSTIVRWCREHRLGIAERVTLLAKVARAAAAAHAALVVHRDIKPSNVLVNEAGEPVLLDFGIAKLLQPESDQERTGSGYAPMTPEYAAPEQLRGEAVSTATDVYALGVLLYELLAGSRPDRARPRAPSSVLAAQRAATTTGTGTAQRIGRDLDRIVQMALADDPARRYPGAAALADDLERFLSHQPVLAHPPSVWYRTSKFVQRHRGGVALTALLVLGMLASLALAIDQARGARLEAARARTVQEFLVGAVESARAVQPRDERPGIDDVVDAAARRARNDASLDPRTRAELLLALGKVALSASDDARAADLLAASRALASSLAPDRCGSGRRVA